MAGCGNGKRISEHNEALHRSGVHFQLFPQSLALARPVSLVVLSQQVCIQHHYRGTTKMGATYGTGLLNYLPADLTDEERLSITDQFVNACGTPSSIREVIGDRVSEWVPHIENNVMDCHDQQWLPEVEAEAIISYNRGSGGSAPYSWFEYLDGWMILIPGWDLFTSQCTIEIPHNRPCDFYFREYDDFFREIERINKRIQEDDPVNWEGSARTQSEMIEFHDDLVADMKIAKRHKLIYYLGD